MIPPLTDLAPGPDVPRQPVVADGATLSFADFLGSASSAEIPDDRPRGSGAQAQLFNQHGFFGHAQTWAMSVAVQPVAAIDPPPLPVEDAAVTAAPSGPAITPDAPVRMIGRAAPSSTVDNAWAAPAPMAMPVAPMPVRAVSPLATALRPVENAPSGPTPRAATVRLPVRPLTATVAVALHATAHGMEVVAQVAGLDERDRAALAEEVAALLCRHGYAPAHISVIAAARAAHREHR